MYKIFLGLLFVVLIGSCSSDSIIADKNVERNAEFTALMDSAYLSEIRLSPVALTRLGYKERYGEWDDLSDAGLDAELALKKDILLQLNSWDAPLSETSSLDRDLYVQKLEQSIAEDQYRYHRYLSHQMRGIHDFIPSFLINFHKINSAEDAEAYISRVAASPEYLDQAIAQMTIQESKGIAPPAFIFSQVIESSENVLKGFPFTNGEQSTIHADFTKKIREIDLSKDQEDLYLFQLQEALTDKLKPAYERLIAYFQKVKNKYPNSYGVWNLPDGAEYYTAQLRKMTTTDLSGEQIFQTGKREIDRIHKEMNAIKEKVNFNGDLSSFFDHLRESDEFYYSNDESGRQQYLTRTDSIVEGMRKKLPELFNTLPKAELIVKPVEAFREKAAGKAFYNGPAPDGSRPGTYYVNLYDMKNMPHYQLEALAYHEAIPGHHMQISINQELDGLPMHRRYGSRYIAYIEGWGLYSEYIPKELGFYKDPYSDFGRLAMELWRSCRLVVDVGIHQKRWTRQQAIDFYAENTPNPVPDAVKMVERHFVMPGQATAYKIGQIKILELREHAKSILAEHFDIRDFHDVILRNGALPLDILEAKVNEYIAANSNR